MRDQRLAPAGDSSTSIGSSRRWLSRRPLVSRSRDPLEQHALVGDVLVDDRDAVFINGDDERIPELAPAASAV